MVDRVDADAFEVEDDPALAAGEGDGRVEADRAFHPGQVGADAVGEHDVVVAAGLGRRIVAAVTCVLQAVVLVPGLEIGPHPDGLGVGEEVDQVERVGVVAEEHRPRPAHLHDDLRQRADLAAPDDPAGLDELGEPPAGVVDVHRDAGRADGRHDRVGVLERRRDRLFAEDPAHAGFDGGLDDAAMEVVRRDDRDELRALGAEHLGIVIVDLSGPGIEATSGLERLPRGCRDVAAGDQLEVRDRGDCRRVAVRDRGAERRSEPAPRDPRRSSSRPTSAMRRVIEPRAAGLDRPGFATVLSPLILRHRSSPTRSRTSIDRQRTPDTGRRTPSFVDLSWRTGLV